MPPKRKAVNKAGVESDDPPPTTRSSTRIRNKQFLAASNPVSDAGHLETRAMSSAPKQNAARKRGPWGEDYLMTSTKSAFVHADLVRLFSNPKAWECLEEDEKRELLSLLPAHIHPNPDPDPDKPEAKIPPLPESFLRYDNNWRAALRNFQSDLESGRYKPEWQRQAKLAVQERAQGKFDDFKEQEFEQFWGQKQKINHGLIAGESSKVKLETLIAHKVVRVGDVWKYCRIFGAKKAKVVVEKEVKITAIDGAKLSFLMPTGQRVFLSAIGEVTPKNEKVEQEMIGDDKENIKDTKTEDAKTEVEKSSDEIRDGKTENSGIQVEVKNDTQMDIDSCPTSQPVQNPPSQALQQPAQDESTAQYSLKGLLDYALSSTEAGTEAENIENADKPAQEMTEQPAAPQTGAIGAVTETVTRRSGRIAKRKSPHDEAQDASAGINGAIESKVQECSKEGVEKPADITETGVNPSTVAGSASEHEKESSHNSQQTANPVVMESTETAVSPDSGEQETTQSSAPNTTPLEIEIHNIAGPNALTKKILESDGRVRNPPNGNAWKEIRCYRNNQDMGSLWEVRQAWYIKQQQEE